MTDREAPKPETLKDEDIVSVRKMRRRKLLAYAGIGVAAGAVALIATTAVTSHASDSKRLESDKTPPKIDPDRD
jgi:hypothetical protein